MPWSLLARIAYNARLTSVAAPRKFEVREFTMVVNVPRDAKSRPLIDWIGHRIVCVAAATIPRF
jgi:hypothetical protein